MKYCALICLLAFTATASAEAPAPSAFTITTKSLTVPQTNATKKVVVAQLWEVRWRSFDLMFVGSTCGDYEPHLEAFLTEREAEAFAESLYKANELIQNGTDLDIEVRKAR